MIYKTSSANEQIEDIKSVQNNILNEEKELIISKKDFDQKILNGEKKLEKINAKVQKKPSPEKTG